MDVPHNLPPLDAPTNDWDQFDLTATTTAKRVEEAGQGGRTVRFAIIAADEANTDDVRIGPNENASYKLLAGGQEYVLPHPSEHLFTLGNWWVKSVSGSQTVHVLYQ